jgi:arabinofuranan 3-O-arabinosyltransferase
MSDHVANAGKVDVRAGVPSIVMFAAAILVAMNTICLPVFYVVGSWIVDNNGHNILADFGTLWTTGRLVRENHPALAYDWEAVRQAMIALTGDPHLGRFGFHYPPPFLFVVAALAQFPYAASCVGWVIVSTVLYAAVVRTLVGRPVGWWLALAFPALFFNSIIGQNGCLTAALIGGALLLLPTRPILAGICLGLLTYKPQFGLLFPIALIAAGQWRVVFSATATAIVISIASLVAFGSETWLAFFQQAPMTSQAFLSDGEAYFGKMQSLFAFVRYCGGGEAIAWIAHWSFVAAIAVALVYLWRSAARYEIKAAALATGAVLATPYIFMYDLVVLAVPVALVVRVGLETGFARFELRALVVAAALLTGFCIVTAPLGFVAALVLAGVIADRALGELGVSHFSSARLASG